MPDNTQIAAVNVSLWLTYSLQTAEIVVWFMVVSFANCAVCKFTDCHPALSLSLSGVTMLS